MTQRMETEAYIPAAHAMARGDDDLRQELCLLAVESVRAGKPRAHVIQGMRRRRAMYFEGYLAVDRYGCSLDNGPKIRRPGRMRLPMEGENGEIFDAGLVEYCTCSVASPEDIALFRVAYGRFMATLSGPERPYWTWKAGDGAGPAPVMSGRKKAQMRKDLRQRFYDIVEGDGLQHGTRRDE